MNEDDKKTRADKTKKEPKREPKKEPNKVDWKGPSYNEASKTWVRDDDIAVHP